MEVNLTPEQESHLARMAAHTDVALRAIERDANIRAAVDVGIAQADRGELIDNEEVLRWLEAREQSV